MIEPGREEFHQLATDHTVVPVWRELVADLITPVAAFGRVVADEPGFLLESVEHGERWSRFSFVGRRPLATVVSKDGELTVDGELDPVLPTDQGVLAFIEAALLRYRSPAIDRLPPLHGGIMGYLGYDVVREVEHLPDAPADDQSYPDAVLSVIGQLAVFDHFRQRVFLIDNVLLSGDETPDQLDAAYDAAAARVDQMAADGARSVDEPLVAPPGADDLLDPDEVRSSMGGSRYEDAVRVAREYVLAGDVFQVVLSQRFDFTLDADPFDYYRVLRQVNPSPYMYFVRLPQLSLVGCSPEPMVQLREGTVISRPIAGTRWRLSLIHISEPTRLWSGSRLPSSA